MQTLIHLFLSFCFSAAVTGVGDTVDVVVDFLFQQENAGTTEYYFRGLSSVIYFYKSQNGTRTHPARSCRELNLEHPDYPSGE